MKSVTYIRHFLLTAALGAFVISCAPRTWRPPSQNVIYTEKGVASWYGGKFHGRRTSNGEKYDMYGLTAAHRTLPFETIVVVTHMRTGSQVTVKINDRGPFVKGRIIDLSYGAARRLGMAKEGIAEVTIEAFADPAAGASAGSAAPSSAGTSPGAAVGSAPLSPGGGPSDFTVQVGSFLVRRNAEVLRDILTGDFEEVSLTSFDEGEHTYYRVRVGHFSTIEEARVEAEKLESEEHQTFIVRRD